MKSLKSSTSTVVGQILRADELSEKGLSRCGKLGFWSVVFSFLPEYSGCNVISGCSA